MDKKDIAKLFEQIMKDNAPQALPPIYAQFHVEGAEADSGKFNSFLGAGMVDKDGGKVASAVTHVPQDPAELYALITSIIAAVSLQQLKLHGNPEVLSLIQDATMSGISGGAQAFLSEVNPEAAELVGAMEIIRKLTQT